MRALVPVAGVVIFGSHGSEGGWTAELPADPPPIHLARLADAGRELACDTPGALVEQKPAGLAFHDRQVPDRKVDAWRDKLDRWLATQDLRGLERLDGRRVVELRTAGAGKGRVVRALDLTPGLDESVVAIGDDVTDEDMFRELGGHGLAVKVGDGRRTTVAGERLPGTDDVRRLLARLAELPVSRG